MLYEQYRLIEQIAATPQFAAYRAHDDQRQEVVRLIELHKDAYADWDDVERRLLKCQLLRLPNFLQILDLRLDDSPPVVVTQWRCTKTLASLWRDRLPAPLPTVLNLGRSLAQNVEVAHRFGVSLENLTPTGVGLDDEHAVRLDLLGAVDSTVDRWARPAESKGVCFAYTCDIFQLAATLYWLLGGPVPNPVRPLRPDDVVLLTDRQTVSPKFRDLLARAFDPEPEMRPAAGEFLCRLTAVTDSGHDVSSLSLGETIPPGQSGMTIAESVASRTHDDADSDGVGFEPPNQLGRFQILEFLGRGGMGMVYRGLDPIDRSVVAIKTLRSDLASNPHSLKRFLNEARMLSEVCNPYVTNLLEVNVDRGIHYIVMEYVAGKPVSAFLKGGSPLDESFALFVIACVARALADAHERGIVHRDVKPSNILILTGRADTPTLDQTIAEEELDVTTIMNLKDRILVKLSDFGLARPVAQSESLDVTRAGAVVGTPYYMSPEQCIGKSTIDSRSDVYSLGATLFHLLTGRPPYLADDAMALAGMHCNDPIPKVQQFNEKVSDAAQQIVERAMSKFPDDRYQTAGEMLEDVERVLRGEPTAVNLHPLLPNSRSGKPVAVDFTWQLNASPRQLWPYVSDTDRLNHAIGLPAVEYQTNLNASKQVERTATARMAGVNIQWREHPFEWIEGRRFGVLREFYNGPFHWFATIVELSPKAGGGTMLTQRFRIEPRGLVGRTLAKVNFGNKLRRELDQVYSRIDAAVSGLLGPQPVDPFGEAAPLPPQQRRALDQAAERLSRNPRLNALTIQKLRDFLAAAPEPLVARIRPLALAEFLGVDGNELVEICLFAAHEGLLVLQWDLLCPVCRIASEVKDTLRELRDHGHCEACNLDFELDFANSIEMIFQVHSSIRPVERKTYCIGGPAHSPHVLAQVRLAPREVVTVDLELSEGGYKLRGPQLPYWQELRVRPGAGEVRWSHTFSSKGAAPAPAFRPGKQTLLLGNDFEQELLVRVERVTQRQDALTAARACSNAVFRELYPEEVLSPGQLVNVATATFLVTEIEEGAELYRRLGDARAFGILHEHFRILDDAIRRENGALVKTLGQGVLAVFGDSLSAMRVALPLQDRLANHPTTKDLRLKAVVHNGTAMAATLNDRLDYFGATVNTALQWAAQVPAGEIWMSPSVAADPAVFELLRSAGRRAEVVRLADATRMHRTTIAPPA